MNLFADTTQLNTFHDIFSGCLTKALTAKKLHHLHPLSNKICKQAMEDMKSHLKAKLEKKLGGTTEHSKDEVQEIARQSMKEAHMEFFKSFLDKVATAYQQQQISTKESMDLGLTFKTVFEEVDGALSESISVDQYNSSNPFHQKHMESMRNEVYAALYHAAHPYYKNQEECHQFCIFTMKGLFNLVQSIESITDESSAALIVRLVRFLTDCCEKADFSEKDTHYFISSVLQRWKTFADSLSFNNVNL